MTGSRDFDVVIVGAGLAGCATAQALALADQAQERKILLLDLHRGGSPKFSGEFIHPRGAQVLDDLGFYGPLLAAGAVDVDGFVVWASAEGDRVELDYASLPGQRRHGISVHHRTLVPVMRRVVTERPQVELREGTRVVELIRESGRIRGVVVREGDSAPEQIRCDVVVAADGKASATRKLAGIPDDRATLGFTAGIEIEDAQVPDPYHANVILGAAGPMLCYPIERRERDGGTLIHRLTFDLPHALPAKGKLLADYLISAFVPYLPTRLAQQSAEVLRRSAGTLELATTVNLPAPPATLPGFALVGDAAGCSHPITASGMTMGLLDALHLGREARRDPGAGSGTSEGSPWLGPAQLRRYRAEHDRYVPTRQALADAIFEAFRGERSGSRTIRRALFRYWHADERNRARSLALLACAERRPTVFLSEYLRTARHAMSSSVSPDHAQHFPLGDRWREMRGAVGLARDKFGLVANVAWAQMKPHWLTPS